jgi:hypothetical protein
MPADKKWWFFRFHGLLIGNPDIDLDNLTFRDTEIVAPHILASMITQTTSDLQYQKTLIGAIYHPFMRPAESFLVVSLMVPHGRDLKQFAEKAFERARVVGALLSLYRLAVGNIPVSCGLGRDVNHNFYDSLRFDKPGWGLDFEQQGRIAFTFPQPQPVTRSALIADLQSPELAELTKVVLEPGSLRIGTKLTAAIVRLASGVWANEPESMLLGAFTSTEMMLGSSGHDRLKARIQTLLGTELASKLKLEEVSQGRHHYVHRGEPVTVELGLTAIALAFAVLLCYAKLAYSLDEDVCTPDFIDLLLDLSAKNPPVSAEQLAKVFKSHNIAAFRPVIETQFYKPRTDQFTITIPAALPSNKDSSDAALIDMITREYVNMSSALGLAPDWALFRLSHFYEKACAKFSPEKVDAGLVRIQIILEQQHNFETTNPNSPVGPGHDQ